MLIVERIWRERRLRISTFTGLLSDLRSTFGAWRGNGLHSSATQSVSNWFALQTVSELTLQKVLDAGTRQTTSDLFELHVAQFAR
jgi:hypothetical protein